MQFMNLQPRKEKHKGDQEEETYDVSNISANTALKIDRFVSRLVREAGTTDDATAQSESSKKKDGGKGEAKNKSDVMDENSEEGDQKYIDQKRMIGKYSSTKLKMK